MERSEAREEFYSLGVGHMGEFTSRSSVVLK